MQLKTTLVVKSNWQNWRSEHQQSTTLQSRQMSV